MILSFNKFTMSDIMLSSDTEMITTFSIISVILMIPIIIFLYLKDSQYLKDKPQIENLFQKISYLFISYIFILQGGILYHINYPEYSLSGSEDGILITENENSHPMISFIILLLFILSLLMTCMSVIKNDNNKMTQLNKEEIDMLEYDNLT